ncbi:MAG TPA: hypothetical protein ENH63_13240 [Sulfitobacter litoralis]|uniref:Transposase n=1 Tax=Sulfitobacter litoralis TaxID=335975 RepID=A0A7V1BGD1_9RHOB|nr:hypothetical protein [Sulfitobacter litoralis]HDZ52717.1 hypothetical protein [Sulfitobacter litoralis]
MTQFIKEHREVCGVEPICRVLKIAPSTFYAHLAVENEQDKASDRAKRLEVMRILILTKPYTDKLFRR